MRVVLLISIYIKRLLFVINNINNTMNHRIITANSPKDRAKRALYSLYFEQNRKTTDTRELNSNYISLNLKKKYSRIQDQHYANSINKILKEKRSKELVQFIDHKEYHKSRGCIKKTYKKKHLQKKIKFYTAFYRYHYDIPRMFMLEFLDTVDSFYNKKREDIYYMAIKKIGKDNIVGDESSNEEGSESLPKRKSKKKKHYPNILNSILKKINFNTSEKDQNVTLKRRNTLKDKKKGAASRGSNNYSSAAGDQNLSENEGDRTHQELKDILEDIGGTPPKSLRIQGVYSPSIKNPRFKFQRQYSNKFRSELSTTRETSSHLLDFGPPIREYGALGMIINEDQENPLDITPIEVIQLPEETSLFQSHLREKDFKKKRKFQKKLLKKSNRLTKSTFKLNKLKVGVPEKTRGHIIKTTRVVSKASKKSRGFNYKMKSSKSIGVKRTELNHHRTTRQKVKVSPENLICPEIYENRTNIARQSDSKGFRLSTLTDRRSLNFNFFGSQKFSTEESPNKPVFRNKPNLDHITSNDNIRSSLKNQPKIHRRKGSIKVAVATNNYRSKNNYMEQMRKPRRNQQDLLRKSKSNRFKVPEKISARRKNFESVKLPDAAGQMDLRRSIKFGRVKSEEISQKTIKELRMLARKNNFGKEI